MAMEATATSTAAPPADKRNGFTDDDFAPFRDYRAKEPPPNFEEIPIAELAATVTLGGIEAEVGPGWVRPPDAGHVAWARWFYVHGQNGGRTGEGYVFWYAGSAGRGSYAAVARGGRFALCKHEKVDGPGARPERGWHPGRCRKCGLDMTVDSGD